MFRVVLRAERVPYTMTVVSEKYFEFVFDSVMLFSLHFSRDNKIKSEYRLKNNIMEKFII